MSVAAAPRLVPQDLQIESWKPSWDAIGRRGVRRRGLVQKVARRLADAAEAAGDGGTSGSPTTGAQADGDTRLAALEQLERDLHRLADLKAQGDHFVWCRRYLARQINQAPAPMHRRVIGDALAFLDRRVPDPERFPDCADKGVYAMPRGHGKSTLLSFSFPLRVIYEWRSFELYTYADENGRRQVEQRPFIVVVSATQDQANDRVRQIREEIERNKELREAYGDKQPYTRNRKWGDGEFITVDGARVVAVGLDASFRGLVEGEARPNLILLDDCDDEKKLGSDEVRSKTWTKLIKEVLGLPIEGESVILGWGTILHGDSMLARLMDHAGEMKGWIRRLFQALPVRDTDEQKAGEAAWPAKWSKARLLKKRDSIPAFAWQTEYQNQPADDSTSMFSMEKWLKPAMARGAMRMTPIMPLPREDESPEGFVLVLQAWDLAFTDDPKKALAANSSYNVGGTLAVDTRGHLHVCKGVRIRGLDPTELQELITAEAALLVPDVVVIESNHAGHVHAHQIAKNTGVRIVTRYTGGTDANKRDLYRGIPGMQHPFAKNQIHLWCGDEHNRAFAKTLAGELHEFPRAAHDDTVMMLWHGWSAAFKAMVVAAQFHARGLVGEVRKQMRTGGR